MKLYSALLLMLAMASTVSAAAVKDTKLRVLEVVRQGPSVPEQMESFVVRACKAYSTISDLGDAALPDGSPAPPEKLPDSRQFVEDVQAACAEEPRNVERVVSLIASAAHKKEMDTSTATSEEKHVEALEQEEKLQKVCEKLQENHEQLSASMLALKASSERRGGDTNSGDITGHQLATEMLDMYECYCDDENTENVGCTEKSAQFLEDVGASVEHQLEEDFHGDGGASFAENLHASLERQTGGLRASSSGSAEANMSSLVETFGRSSVGKCNPPGLQEVPGQPGNYKVCLYAGSVFECEFGWDSQAAGCLPAIECGGGVAGASIKGSVKVCLDTMIIEMEMKMCVAVISDVIGALQRANIPGVNEFFESLGIYGGCYRLGLATYDITENRISIIPTTIKTTLILPFKVAIGGHAYMRFKGYDCAYTDGDWATREKYVAENDGGDYFLQTSEDEVARLGTAAAAKDSTDIGTLKQRVSDAQQIKRRQNEFVGYEDGAAPVFTVPDTSSVIAFASKFDASCPWKTGPWAQYTVKFSLIADIPRVCVWVPTCSWGGCSWQLHCAGGAESIFALNTACKVSDSGMSCNAGFTSHDF